MPCRQSISVPKQSNVSQRSANEVLLPARGAVRHRLLRSLVDVLGSHQDSGLDAAQRPRRTDAHRERRSGCIVDAVDDDVHIRLAETVVEGLELSAKRLDSYLDRGAAAGASILQH